MAAPANSVTLAVPDAHEHGAGAGAETPRKPQRRGVRPRITLPIFHLPPSRHGSPQHQPPPPHPHAHAHAHAAAAAAPVSPAHTPMVSIPMTPVGGVPIAGAQGGTLGMIQLYPNKASQFVFKGFEGFKEITMNTAKSGLSVGEKTAFWLYGKISSWSRKWFTHMFLFLVVLSYSLLGAFIFRVVEGSHEDRVLAAVKDIHDERLRLLRELRALGREARLAGDEEAWLREAAQRVVDYEQGVVLDWHDHALDTNVSKEDNKKWTFWNTVFFCGTIYTTIGYGHLSPSTTTGRAITIVYAIFGIPLFLILLADFGKLFTRGIKFLWAFVRRLYYTGSCRKVRRTGPVQEVMKGVQLVYDFAKFRRPSEVPPGEGPGEESDVHTPLNQPPPQVQIHEPSLPPEGVPQTIPLDGREPSTPVPSVYEVDDEFNLPISIAITILLTYIFVGAAVYYIWEDWGFFESFYFVFISMSTIGFGDFVPKHPMYMMASIVYLVFGLALTSMCINVVQEKLSDSFRQASAKIGATIGLRVAEEDGNISPVEQPSAQPQEVEIVPAMTKSAST